jgi:hypothetical protein
MRKGTFCCFALLSISMAASVGGQSPQVPLDQPQPQQTFKSAVDLVTIQASVRPHHQ